MLEGLVAAEQVALRRQGVAHLLREGENELSLGQVQGDDLCHLLVTQRQGGCERAIDVHAKDPSSLQRLRHRASGGLVGDEEHALLGKQDLGLRGEYANFALLGEPIASDKSQFVRLAATYCAQHTCEPLPVDLPLAARCMLYTQSFTYLTQEGAHG